jgi:hypothetical protein
VAENSNLLGMPFNERFDLFLRAIIPVGGDPTYTVLKTHLLIEEMLVEYINRKLPNPAAMKGARLSFSQRLSLVRAMQVSGSDHWSWDGIERLNTIRNMLAHQRDAAGFPAKVQEFIEFMQKHTNVPLPPPLGTTVGSVASQPQPLYRAMEMVLGALFVIVGERLGVEGEDVRVLLHRLTSTPGSASTA